MTPYLLKRVMIFLIIIFTPLICKEPPAVSWGLLSKYDFTTNDIPGAIQQLNDQIIDISGFIVPIEFGEFMDSIQEFILVPDPLSCMHVPPPPLNQMIHVKMASPIPLNIDFRGVRIRGRLSVINYTPSNDQFIYQMQGITASEDNIEFEEPMIHEYQLPIDIF